MQPKQIKQVINILLILDLVLSNLAVPDKNPALAQFSLRQKATFQAKTSRQSIETSLTGQQGKSTLISVESLSSTKSSSAGEDKQWSDYAEEIIPYDRAVVRELIALAKLSDFDLEQIYRETSAEFANYYRDDLSPVIHQACQHKKNMIISSNRQKAIYLISKLSFRQLIRIYRAYQFSRNIRIRRGELFYIDDIPDLIHERIKDGDWRGEDNLVNQLIAIAADESQGLKEKEHQARTLLDKARLDEMQSSGLLDLYKSHIDNEWCRHDKKIDFSIGELIKERLRPKGPAGFLRHIRSAFSISNFLNKIIGYLEVEAVFYFIKAGVLINEMVKGNYSVLTGEFYSPVPLSIALDTFLIVFPVLGIYDSVKTSIITKRLTANIKIAGIGHKIRFRKFNEEEKKNALSFNLEWNGYAHRPDEVEVLEVEVKSRTDPEGFRVKLLLPSRPGFIRNVSRNIIRYIWQWQSSFVEQTDTGKKIVNRDSLSETISQYPLGFTEDKVIERPSRVSAREALDGYAASAEGRQQLPTEDSKPRPPFDTDESVSAIPVKAEETEPERKQFDPERQKLTNMVQKELDALEAEEGAVPTGEALVIGELTPIEELIPANLNLKNLSEEQKKLLARRIAELLFVKEPATGPIKALSPEHIADLRSQVAEIYYKVIAEEEIEPALELNLPPQYVNSTGVINFINNHVTYIYVERGERDITCKVIARCIPYGKIFFIDVYREDRSTRTPVIRIMYDFNQERGRQNELNIKSIYIDAEPDSEAIDLFSPVFLWFMRRLERSYYHIPLLVNIFGQDHIPEEQFTKIIKQIGQHTSEVRTHHTDEGPVYYQFSTRGISDYGVREGLSERYRRQPHFNIDMTKRVNDEEFATAVGAKKDNSTKKLKAIEGATLEVKVRHRLTFDLPGESTDVYFIEDTTTDGKPIEEAVGGFVAEDLNRRYGIYVFIDRAVENVKENLGRLSNIGGSPVTLEQELLLEAFDKEGILSVRDQVIIDVWERCIIHEIDHLLRLRNKEFGLTPAEDIKRRKEKLAYLAPVVFATNPHFQLFELLNPLPDSPHKDAVKAIMDEFIKKALRREKPWMERDDYSAPKIAVSAIPTEKVLQLIREQYPASPVTDQTQLSVPFTVINTSLLDLTKGSNPTVCFEPTPRDSNKSSATGRISRIPLERFTLKEQVTQTKPLPATDWTDLGIKPFSAGKQTSTPSAITTKVSTQVERLKDAIDVLDQSA